MKTRIGLFTPKRHPHKKGEATTTTTYVEIDALADLAAKLAELGIKQIGLLRRDRSGATHIEGTMFPASELKPETLAWLTAKSAEFETRGLYCETV
jgi:hypothetical protein